MRDFHARNIGKAVPLTYFFSSPAELFTSRATLISASRHGQRGSPLLRSFRRSPRLTSSRLADRHVRDRGEHRYEVRAAPVEVMRSAGLPRSSPNVELKACGFCRQGRAVQIVERRVHWRRPCAAAGVRKPADHVEALLFSASSVIDGDPVDPGGEHGGMAQCRESFNVALGIVGHDTPLSAAGRSLLCLRW